MYFKDIKYGYCFSVCVFVFVSARRAALKITIGIVMFSWFVIELPHHMSSFILIVF